MATPAFTEVDHGIRSRLTAPDQTSSVPEAGWAKRICASWGKSVAAVVDVGRLLSETKASVGHGGFARLFRGNAGAVPQPVPFSQGTAERLMRIADHPVLANPAHGPSLPSGWRTLYELALLDEDSLAAAIARGDVCPEMTRSDAVRLRRPTKPTAAGWSLRDTEARLRAAVDQELRRCPLGEERAIEAIVQNIATDLERYRTKHDRLMDAGVEALAEYREQLENAAPGQRTFVRTRKWGRLVGVVPEPSTFPGDMCGLPRTRRSAERLVQACGQVYDGKISDRLGRGLLDWAAEAGAHREYLDEIDESGANKVPDVSTNRAVTFVCATCAAIVSQVEGGRCPKCADGILLEQLEFPAV